MTGISISGPTSGLASLKAGAVQPGASAKTAASPGGGGASADTTTTTTNANGSITTTVTGPTGAVLSTSTTGGSKADAGAKGPANAGSAGLLDVSA